MKDKLNIFFRLQSQIFRIFLFFLCVIFIVYLIPKNTKFKYDFKEGMPWKYETLISPFDFEIYKTSKEIEIEKKIVTSKSEKYFNLNNEFLDSVFNEIDSLTKFLTSISKSDLILNIKKVYDKGFTDFDDDLLIDSVIVSYGPDTSKIVFSEIKKNPILLLDSLKFLSTSDSLLLSNVFQNLKPNIFFDKKRTDEILNYNLSQINKSKELSNPE